MWDLGAAPLPYQSEVVTPEIVMIMTESRERKAAFLREAVRVLGLEGYQRKNCQV